MNNTLDNLSEELKIAVNQIAESIKPIIDDIHKMDAVSKNYYAEYLNVLSHASNKGKGYVKLLAISMLKAGCNPIGIDAAVKIMYN